MCEFARMCEGRGPRYRIVGFACFVWSEETLVWTVNSFHTCAEMILNRNWGHVTVINRTVSLEERLMQLRLILSVRFFGKGKKKTCTCAPSAVQVTTEPVYALWPRKGWKPDQITRARIVVRCCRGRKKKWAKTVDILREWMYDDVWMNAE